MIKRLFKYSFVLVIIALFLYSFTQVDLSLTLSRASLYQTIEKTFQHIGYFNRPLSTLLFVVIISAMFSYYIYFLRQAIKKKVNIKQIWILIIATAGILAFSYNAFSYDFFNYIFYTKIITYYHQNPYLATTLDFPGDPMLSFMHWTHNTYPYGPFWLVLTVPLGLIGHNILLATFFLFKFLVSGFYLGSSYLVWKINKKILPGREDFNLILFALNPLVIIESLVSGHNDIAMIFFALLGLYLYFVRKKILAIIAIIISSQIKIPTIALIAPIILSFIPMKRRLDNEKFVWVSIFVSLAAFFYVLTKLEIQPWYFLWILPLIALLKPNKYIVSLTVGLSLGLLLRYTPFLYSGNWNGIAPQVKGTVTLLAPFVFLIGQFIFSRIYHNGKNN